MERAMLFAHDLGAAKNIATLERFLSEILEIKTHIDSDKIQHFFDRKFFPSSTSRFPKLQVGQAHHLADKIKKFKPDMIICGTSASGWTLEATATIMGKDLRIPVVWVEDYTLTSCSKHLMSLEPDYLFTATEARKMLILQRRPNFPADRVIVTRGCPADDALAGLDYEAGRKKYRKFLAERFGVDLKQPLFVIAGQVAGTETLLNNVIPLIREASPQSTIIVGLHPIRDPKGGNYQVFSLYPDIINITGSQEITCDQAALASDCLITMYSTVGTNLVLMGGKVLYYLAGECGVALINEKGVTTLPEIEDGVALSTMVGSLVFQEKLEKVLYSENWPRNCDVWQKMYRPDGQATRRTRDELMRLNLALY